VPDTKDWTWVLDRRCPECGLDTREITRSTVASTIRENAGAWRRVLSEPGARERRQPGVWSTLEYACHVRDVFGLFDERLTLMLTQDNPRYSNWNQDETAVSSRYAEQDPTQVAADLSAAAQTIAARFETVSGPQWERTGTRSDGAVFTVDTFARYLLHDVLHHVHDVTAAPPR